MERRRLGDAAWSDAAWASAAWSDAAWASAAWSDAAWSDAAWSDAAWADAAWASAAWADASARPILPSPWPQTIASAAEIAQTAAALGLTTTPVCDPLVSSCTQPPAAGTAP